MRNYHKLSHYIENRLKKRVEVHFQGEKFSQRNNLIYDVKKEQAPENSLNSTF